MRHGLVAKTALGSASRRSAVRKGASGGRGSTCAGSASPGPGTNTNVLSACDSQLNECEAFRVFIQKPNKPHTRVHSACGSHPCVWRLLL